MGIARILALATLLLAPSAVLGKATGFTRVVAGAEVDWSTGTITAEAGSAADLRMPGPSSARPGAERRARATAEERLRAAVDVLSQGQKLAELDDKQRLERATVTRTEYQSDGGVVLWLALRFTDLAPAKPASLALRVSTMPFELTPAIAVSGREGRLGLATYQPAAEAPRDALRVSRDGKGRLQLPASAGTLDSLAGASVVIYLEKAP